MSQLSDSSPNLGVFGDLTVMRHGDGRITLLRGTQREVLAATDQVPTVPAAPLPWHWRLLAKALTVVSLAQSLVALMSTACTPEQNTRSS